MGTPNPLLSSAKKTTTQTTPVTSWRMKPRIASPRFMTAPTSSRSSGESQTQFRSQNKTICVLYPWWHHIPDTIDSMLFIVIFVLSSPRPLLLAFCVIMTVLLFLFSVHDPLAVYVSILSMCPCFVFSVKGATKAVIVDGPVQFCSLKRNLWWNWASQWLCVHLQDIRKSK